MNHTPGPWKYEHFSHGYYMISQDHAAIEREWGYIAQVRDHSANSERTLANARLITAAPELLAAALAAVEWVGMDGDGISDPVLEQLRRAIAKAGGHGGTRGRE